MTTKLTDRAIRALKPVPGKRLELADSVIAGLRIRAGKTHHSWYFRYNDRDTGKKVPLHLGSYPAMSLQEAREAGLRQRALLGQNIDPRAYRRDSLDAERSSRTYTVRQVIDDFLNYATRHRAPKTVADYRRYLEQLEKLWGDRDAASVRRGDVLEVLDQTSSRGHRAAGHLLASARAAWSFAVEHERLEFNPWTNLKRRASAYGAQSRDRALNDTELRALFTQLPESGLPKHSQIVIWLLLWSGCRPGEVCGSEWRELDSETGVWSIPATRMKARRAHQVMLPKQARNTLKSHRRSLGRGQHRYVFPAPNRLGHLDTTVFAKQLRQALSGRKLKVVDFHAHDLRRTTATGLARLGAPREVIKRVLAHTDSDVTSIYQRHQYDEQAREWLQRWADHLDALVAHNVIPLGREGLL